MWGPLDVDDGTVTPIFRWHVHEIVLQDAAVTLQPSILVVRSALANPEFTDVETHHRGAEISRQSTLVTA